MTEFEPKMIGFLCTWCTYAGADLAGVSRFQYPPTVRNIRVMCSGRIDPHILFEAFIQGMDGVFIGGCHPGDCHYLEGNYNAERKIKMTKKLLEKTGFEPERLRLEWISASEGQLFAEVMTEFSAKIKELGPSPVGGDSPDTEILRKLLAAKDATLDFRLRAIVAKEYKITAKDGNIYGEMKDQKEWDEFLDDAIEAEFERKQILKMIRDTPMSVKEISGNIGLTTEKVVQHVILLRAKNQIGLDSIDGLSPKYLNIMVGGD